MGPFRVPTPEPGLGLAVMTQPQAVTLDTRWLPIGKIKPNPNNVRGKDLGDLSDLAASIAEHGVQEPIVVYALEGDKRFEWMAVFGHRRLAASKLAKVKDIPALIRPQPDEASLTELMLIENLHREDLSPVEEASALRRLHELDPARTHSAIAKAVGRSQHWVSDRLAIVEGLPEKSWALFAEGKLEIGDAVEIARSKLDDKAKDLLAAKPVAGYPGARKAQIDDAKRKAKDDVTRAKLVTKYGKSAVLKTRPSGPWGSAQIGAKGGQLNVPANIHAGACPGHRVVFAGSSYGGASPERHYCATPEVHKASEFVSKARPQDGEISLAAAVKAKATPLGAIKFDPDTEGRGSYRYNQTSYHQGCPAAVQVAVPWPGDYAYQDSSIVHACTDPSIHDPASDRFRPLQELYEEWSKARQADRAANLPGTTSSRGNTLELSHEEIEALRDFITERTISDEAAGPSVASMVLRLVDCTTLGEPRDLSMILFDGFRLALIEVLIRDHDDDGYPGPAVDVVEMLADGPLSGLLTEEQLTQLKAARENVWEPDVVVDDPGGSDDDDEPVFEEVD